MVAQRFLRDEWNSERGFPEQACRQIVRDRARHKRSGQGNGREHQQRCGTTQAHDERLGSGIVQPHLEPSDEAAHPFDRVADPSLESGRIAGDAFDDERQRGSSGLRARPDHVFTSEASARMRSMSR
jgi:hypothetical protein